jgi:LacI family transcriptional regulator
VIRQRACQGIGVGEVAEQIGASRTTLKRRFKAFLKRSVHDEILAVQLKRVQSLLVETELPLKQIATRAGFQRISYLSVAFKRRIGMPPGQYRQEHQVEQTGAAMPLNHPLPTDSTR